MVIQTVVEAHVNKTILYHITAAMSSRENMFKAGTGTHKPLSGRRRTLRPNTVAVGQASKIDFSGNEERAGRLVRPSTDSMTGHKVI